MSVYPVKENWHRAAVIHLRSVLFESGQKRYLDLVSEIRYWWPNFVFLYRWCKPMYRPVLLLNTCYRKYTGRPVWDHFEEQRPLVGYKAISVSRHPNFLFVCYMYMHRRKCVLSVWVCVRTNCMYVSFIHVWGTCWTCDLVLNLTPFSFSRHHRKPASTTS